MGNGKKDEELGVVMPWEDAEEDPGSQEEEIREIMKEAVARGETVKKQRIETSAEAELRADEEVVKKLGGRGRT